MIRWLTQPVALGLLELQLAAGQHDLALDVVDLVAIRVDVGEVVVAADRLELVERVAERPVVPQPGVAERVRVVRDGLLGVSGASPVEGAVLPGSSPYASRVIAMLFAM